MAQPLLLSIAPVFMSGETSVDKKFPGVMLTSVWELTPVCVITSPLAVLGVIVAVVTGPAVV